MTNQRDGVPTTAQRRALRLIQEDRYVRRPAGGASAEDDSRITPVISIATLSVLERTKWARWNDVLGCFVLTESGRSASALPELVKPD